MSDTVSLGNPFFEEKGKIIGQRILAVRPETQIEYTFSANGTMNGDIGITDTGTLVSTLRSGGISYSEGQGVIMTKDGSEMATWNAHIIGNVADQGKILFRGSGFYNTSSTGKLAFLNNIITVFKAEVDESGNLSNKEWQWK
jgi:hypothetical protein